MDAIVAALCCAAPEAMLCWNANPQFCLCCMWSRRSRVVHCAGANSTRLLVQAMASSNCARSSQTFTVHLKRELDAVSRQIRERGRLACSQ